MRLDDLISNSRLEETKTVLTVVTSWMVIPLYLIFWLCDILYIPELMWLFLGLRAMAIPIALLTVFALRQIQNFHQIQILASAYTISLALIINCMIYFIGEPATPYYAGLNLIAVGGLSFIPFSVPFFIITACGVFIPYYLIVFSQVQTSSDLSQVFIISFFIISTILITLVVRLYRERLRHKELTIRADLAYEIERRKTAENDLVDARDMALSANDAKSAFLANMSHELRTPLNAIIGFSQLVADECKDDGNEQYTDDLKKIENSAQHLLGLICGILDISKIEAGRMELYNETFDLHDLISETQDLVSPLVKNNANKLEIICPTDIGDAHADQMKLRQILLNLLSNACKFTEGGRIILEIKPFMANQTEWLKIKISDTGIGMTPKQSLKVFQPFIQADNNTASQYGGTGLGLSICQRFCRLMGGNITVNSVPDVGTTFALYLPRDYTDIVNSAQRACDSERRKKAKQVLILQNHQPMLESLLEVTLLNYGFLPISTYLDSEIGEILNEIRPDILLIPSDMIGVNDSTLSFLHEQIRIHKLPVIVVSVDNDAQTGYAIGISNSVIETSKQDTMFNHTLLISSENEDNASSKMQTTHSISNAIGILNEHDYSQVILELDIIETAKQEGIEQLLDIANTKNTKFSLTSGKTPISFASSEALCDINKLLHSIHIPEQQFTHLLTSLLINFARTPENHT